MQHGINRLARTTNGGRKWTATSIPQISGSLIAGSGTRLWFVDLNSLYESADGGYRWSGVPEINTGGTLNQSIDVLSATKAWLLAPGTGLWHTTNGSYWAPPGAVSNHP